jgi:hypothetical protein
MTARRDQGSDILQTADAPAEAGTRFGGGGEVTPAAITVGTITYAGGSLQVARKITVAVTGTAGAFSVPHGMSITPTNVWPGLPSDAAGPAAGSSLWLDVQTVPAGMDGTNIYLFASGPGTFVLYAA